MGLPVMLQSIAQHGQAASAAAAFRARFKAWWNGDAPPGTAPAGVPHGAAAAPAAAPPPPLPGGWTAERAAVVQRLFGEGQALPGGAAALHELLVPLGLKDRHSVVELGSRFGFAARKVVQDTGAYVDAFEAEPALAEVQERLNRASGLGRKLVLLPEPPRAETLKPDSRDAVLGFEALAREGTDDMALLTLVRQALRPGGQLLLVELLYRETPAAPEPALAALNRLEPQPLCPAVLPDLRARLEMLGFDVRIAEDITAPYCKAAKEALLRLDEGLRQHPPAAEQGRWLLREVECWARRVALLKAGRIGAFRLYACIPGSESKG